MTKCSCPPCEKEVVSRITARLDQVQRAMLGYFCRNCIIVRCDHKHKVKDRNNGAAKK